MNAGQLILSVISAITLFLYGLSGFSRELLEVGGQRLQAGLQALTANRFVAALCGAVFTALIQSSSAVSALAISLVDRRVLGFGAALAVLLGANVGTTATAWLISLKLTAIGSIALVVGAVVSAMAPQRWKPSGKVLFYFGFVLFALDLIGASLAPLRASPDIAQVLAHTETPWLGVLIGVGVTALLQSSSVTTGLAVVLVQQQLLPSEAAIYLVVGANIGTTATGLIASVSMGSLARRTAVINAGFNLAGAMIFAPMLVMFARFVVQMSPSPEGAVALAHLIFNLVNAGFFLLLLPCYVGRLERWAMGDESATSGAENGARR